MRSVFCIGKRNMIPCTLHYLIQSISRIYLKTNRDWSEVARLSNELKCNALDALDFLQQLPRALSGQEVFLQFLCLDGYKTGRTSRPMVAVTGDCKMPEYAHPSQYAPGS